MIVVIAQIDRRRPATLNGTFRVRWNGSKSLDRPREPNTLSIQSFGGFARFSGLAWFSGTSDTSSTSGTFGTPDTSSTSGSFGFSWLKSPFALSGTSSIFAQQKRDCKRCAKMP